MSNTNSSAKRLPIENWRGKTVMFIIAHPDDAEGAAGGTISLMKKNGVKVVYLIVTNGDKGCGDNNKVFNCSKVTKKQIAK